MNLIILVRFNIRYITASTREKSTPTHYFSLSEYPSQQRSNGKRNDNK